MKKGTIVALAIVGALVLLIVIIVASVSGSYNNFVTLRENAVKYSSDIDAQLQRRADLIPNLVETVKGYAAHENEIFTAIADARSRLLSAGTMQEKANADASLNSALGRLLAIAENYPDLKANENFLSLQTTLEGSENRIAVARKDYNAAAQAYNAGIKRFPGVILAGMFGFEKLDYFQANDAAKEVPSVDFSK